VDGDGVSAPEGVPAERMESAPGAKADGIRRAKASRVETEARIEAVRKMLLSGTARWAVVADIAAQFNVKERQARNYILEAEQRIRRISEVERAYVYAEHIAIRRELRRRALDGGDLRAALDSAKDEAKLLDLYPAEKHDVRVEDVDAAIERELARLAAARQAEDAGAPEEYPGASAVRADGGPADAV
jgi:hypothetical protein